MKAEIRVMLLQAKKWKWKSFNHVWLFATPWDSLWNSPGQNTGMGRYLFPSPGDLPNPWMEPRSPALQVDSLPAELRGKSLQVEECQMLPTNHQKPGERHGTYYPSEHSEGTNPANTLISDLQPLELWDNSFLLHKPSSLWDFAIIALANWLGFPGN